MSSQHWISQAWTRRGLAALAALIVGCCVAALAGASQSAASCSAGECTVTFGYDATTTQTFTVPSGVTTVTVAAYGAAGGGGSDVDPGAGGQGGRVTGTLAVSPGGSLSVEVGGAGGVNATAAFGGGSPGDDAAGGGGASAVLSGTTTELIAGGGGGAGIGPGGQYGREVGNDGGGGAGGQATAGGSAGTGVTGAPVTDGNGTATLNGGAGGGGAGTAAGAAGNAGTVGSGTDCTEPIDPGGPSPDPRAGAPGGVGASPAAPPAVVKGGTGSYESGGGGGGGGYAGGGGGGGGAYDIDCQYFPEGGGGGGGGGSSYAALGVGSVTYAQGVQSGNGQVVITYADPVTVTNPTYTVDENQTLTVPVARGLVQAAASGPANDTLSASTTSSPADGTATVAASGAFTYAPTSNFVGSDAFGFSVTDQFGDDADGTATVDVIGPPSAPGTPAATGTATAGGASVAFSTPTSTGGSPITSYTVTAAPGGASATGTSSPLTVTGLSPGKTYTFTVTAANAVGTGPASAASNAITVPSDPTASISSPVSGQSYVVGSSLTSAFTCADGSGGSGIAGCVDQTGADSGSTLSTATPGTYTETVTATSQDGLTGTASVTYSVVAPPPVTTTSSTTTPTTTAVTAPVAAGSASVSGAPTSGTAVSCEAPSFSGSPSTVTYQWERDGTPIQGATGSTYTVTAADEGTTLSCEVSATNAAGTTPELASAGVYVPVPKVAGCPAATGTVAGSKLGPLELGFTRSEVTHADTHASTRGGAGTKLFLCLTPTGIRVGFASGQELHALPAGQRTHYRGRVIFISTANASYAIRGVRVGATVAAASRQLTLSRVFVIGLNDWYLARDGKVTAVFKARHGVIEEIGIAVRALTAGSRSRQRTFLTSFG